ncbi:MAG: UDP-N-acetylmuramate--L-alanine ligase [Vicinamibacterales bacterium]
MLGRTRHAHFVGIGGIGMSGIAELLLNLGFGVSGSDARSTDITARLQTLGAVVHLGHAAVHLGDTDVVVISAAVRPDNPEVAEAHRRGIPVIARAEMLAELMRLKYSIAVAGAHGKTTTTSMVALVLERAGLDPTAVIGGRLSAFGGNARLGRGEYLVAEADESDRSFLMLWPTVAVVTNIDREHMESYGSFDALCAAFLEFANRTPFYGGVVACTDDPYVAQLVPQLRRRAVTYGIDRPADIVARDVKLGAFGVRATVWKGEALLGPLELQVPGHHNLLNALAAVGVATELGVPFVQVAAGLAAFQGAERRFQRYGEAGGVLVIDDYGHHPTEIRAVVAAARSSLDRRLLVLFQPHRYSRTSLLLDDFGPAFDGVGEVVLTDIYAAGEDPIPGVTVEALAASMQRAGVRVHIARSLAEAVSQVAALARPGDAVITLGAGSVGTVPPRLLEHLAAHAGSRA